MSGRKNNNSGDLGWLVLMVLAIVAMPFLGVYHLMAGKDDGQRMLGVALIIVGIIVYVMMEIG